MGKRNLKSIKNVNYERKGILRVSKNIKNKWRAGDRETRKDVMKKDERKERNEERQEQRRLMEKEERKRGNEEWQKERR